MRITYSKVDYIQHTEPINPDDLSAETNDYSTNLDPISYVNLRLVNSNPNDSEDVIDFRYISANFPQCDCCDSSAKIVTGAMVDTTITCIIVGDTQLDYIYFVAKDGTENVTTGGVYVDSFETAEITINY